MTQIDDTTWNEVNERVSRIVGSKWVSTDTFAEDCLAEAARNIVREAEAAIDRLNQVVTAFKAHDENPNQETLGRVGMAVFSISSGAGASGPAQSHVAAMLNHAGRFTVAWPVVHNELLTKKLA